MFPFNLQWMKLQAFISFKKEANIEVPKETNPTFYLASRDRQKWLIKTLNDWLSMWKRSTNLIFIGLNGL